MRAHPHPQTYILHGNCQVHSGWETSWKEPIEIGWKTLTWISKLKLFVLFNRLAPLTWDTRVKLMFSLEHVGFALWWGGGGPQQSHSELVPSTTQQSHSELVPSTTQQMNVSTNNIKKWKEYWHITHGGQKWNGNMTSWTNCISNALETWFLGSQSVELIQYYSPAKIHSTYSAPKVSSKNWQTELINNSEVLLTGEPRPIRILAGDHHCHCSHCRIARCFPTRRYQIVYSFFSSFYQIWQDLDI